MKKCRPIEKCLFLHYFSELFAYWLSLAIFRLIQKCLKSTMVKKYQEEPRYKRNWMCIIQSKISSSSSFPSLPFSYALGHYWELVVSQTAVPQSGLGLDALTRKITLITVQELLGSICRGNQREYFSKILDMLSPVFPDPFVLFYRHFCVSQYSIICPHALAENLSCRKN